MIRIRRVIGRSMEPTLRENQLIVAMRRPTIRVGCVVLAEVDGREVIKRVHSLEGERVYVRGDNERYSTDSRSYGPLKHSQIIGVMLWPRKFAKNTSE